ncbi:hypothetical protein BD408DRAFT_427001, partial [Parasitella parasitica]
RFLLAIYSILLQHHSRITTSQLIRIFNIFFLFFSFFSRFIISTSFALFKTCIYSTYGYRFLP